MFILVKSLVKMFNLVIFPIKIVKKITDQVIKKRRETDPGSGPGLNNDLLSRFIGSINDDDYLRDIVISFLSAGRDTVASALTGFFMLLSQNPKVLEKIREESDRVIGPPRETLARFEDLKDLKDISQIGSLARPGLYPQVQFDSKFTNQDDVLPDGSFVKRGSRVTYHPYAMGRMERIWGLDTLEFKPERWIRDGEFKQESVYKYPVFQGGVRVCLGREMALVEMKNVALCLIRRFDVRVVKPDRVRFASGLTATVSGGVHAVVRSGGPM